MIAHFIQPSFLSGSHVCGLSGRCRFVCPYATSQRRAAIISHELNAQLQLLNADAYFHALWRVTEERSKSSSHLTLLGGPAVCAGWSCSKRRRRQSIYCCEIRWWDTNWKQTARTQFASPTTRVNDTLPCDASSSICHRRQIVLDCRRHALTTDSLTTYSLSFRYSALESRNCSP